jgi:hypothetical protein
MIGLRLPRVLDEENNTISSESANPLQPEQLTKDVSIYEMLNNECVESEEMRIIFEVLSKTGAISSDLLGKTNSLCLTQ